MNSPNRQFSRGAYRVPGSRASGFREGRSSSSSSSRNFTGRGDFDFRSSSQDGSSANSTKPGHFQRMYPIGIKRLEELLQREAYIISEELLKRNSGYEQFLDETEVKVYKLCLIIKLLNRAICSRANSDGVVDLLILSFNNVNFRQKLQNFISDVKFDKKEALEYLPLIRDILSHFLRLTPVSAFQAVSPLTDICVGALQFLKEGGSSVGDLEQSFENLKLQLKESRVKFKQSGEAEKRGNMKPPDNFREHQVMPSPAEITASEMPFIRPVIVKGGYQDSHHYLDVQFRLLKEDFVRPLREGLIYYLKGGDYKKSDIRLYFDVKFHSTKIEKSHHHVFYLKLNLKSNFRIENTKRLMFGNILCLSHDDFKTMTLASVNSRERLSDKLLGVRLESEPYALDYTLTYTVVESKAYFVSYKYTLEALQKLEFVPLQNYIVEAKETAAVHPSYLHRFTTYLLPDKLECTVTKGFCLDADLDYKDYEVLLLDDLCYWPSCSELGFDESQRRAFHGALTRQMAIIQGPPGTGKTFLGLKITQVLLHNKIKWSQSNKHPILVVCYTNHALDQFLEGMMPFTRKLVRIGSQSKNEALRDFQINKKLLGHDRTYEDQLLDRRYRDLRFEILSQKENIDLMSEHLERISEPGIIALQCFTQAFYNVMPSKVKQQIQNKNPTGTMKYFLFDSLYQSEAMKDSSGMIAVDNDSASEQAQESNLQSKSVEKTKVDDSSVTTTGSSGSVVVEAQENDVNSKTGGERASSDHIINNEDLAIDEEILKEEEDSRKLDDEDEEEQEGISHDGQTGGRIQYLSCERTLNDILKRVSVLRSAVDANPYKKENRKHENEIEYLVAEFRVIKTGCCITSNEEEEKQLENVPDIWNLGLIERWKLYNYWKKKLLYQYQNSKLHFELEHRKMTDRLLQLKDLKYLSIMRDSDIVGMTTTGAAQYCNLLHDLAPPIVIVEEAAEILEAHVVSSLSINCEHLILIGDHKQLRPKANVYELGLKYNLQISLFERMIKNNINYETLEFQHRMKPLFSKLLVPHVYEDLKDHPSVFHYPEIKGIAKDLFFVDHTEMENAPSDEMESFENRHEAEFTMGLCRHLILQGYTSSDVTIITPYSGQHRTLRRLQKKDEFHPCEGVRISILDNYQGEECNIILISLVRSNPRENVGFMKTDNRICVALSRAKHGMYIIGNMSQMIKASSLWEDIDGKLVKSGHIGSALQLLCQNHPQEHIMVSSYKDFLSKSPEGGCKLKCSAVLPVCNHPCPRLCHVIESNHNSIKCTEKCDKILCTLGHICPLLCYDTCRECKVPVEKRLPCGHTHSVPCAIKPEEFKCKRKVDKELFCKHIITLSCYVDISNYGCPKPCTTRLDCGHQCKRSCHVKDDPNHENYDCHEACEETLENCERGHKCAKKCYEECGRCTAVVTRNLKCGHTLSKVACGVPEDEIVCPSQCKRELPCGHPCPRKCGDKCGGCMVKVSKVVPECQHTIKVECSATPSVALCPGRCVKKLPCGHSCKKKCMEFCSEHSCRELVTSNDSRCPVGHIVRFPCYVLRSANQPSNKITAVNRKTVGEFCTEICGVMLDCGHRCKGQCGKCFNGRLHMNCQETCTRTLVCGHVCKEPCSTDCPPCQQSCLWRCSHSQCLKKCGVPCLGCKEKCERYCDHSRCAARCSARCTRDPCKEPCLKKLKICGHDCIGFCGEPCPKLCKICNNEAIKEIFFGTEDEEDARFIMLEDCKHSFEAEGLESWMTTPATGDDSRVEIGMKKCPKCSVAIYNTKRFQPIILDAYDLVVKVKSRYYSSKKRIQKNELKLKLRDLCRDWPNEAAVLINNLGMDMNFQPFKRQRPISDEQFALYAFQVDFLKAAKAFRPLLQGRETRLKELVALVMKPTLSISSQMMKEITSELRRLEICVLVERVRKSAHNDTVSGIIERIETVMSPTIMFDSVSEQKVRAFLKEAERYIGSLGITKEERLQIVKAIGLTSGHWYACPNGHVYCIGECGGATQEAVCPECKATIGGTNHALRAGNRLAPEMDGATRSAWS